MPELKSGNARNLGVEADVWGKMKGRPEDFIPGLKQRELIKASFPDESPEDLQQFLLKNIHSVFGDLKHLSSDRIIECDEGWTLFYLNRSIIVAAIKGDVDEIQNLTTKRSEWVEKLKPENEEFLEREAESINKGAEKLVEGVRNVRSQMSELQKRKDKAENDIRQQLYAELPGPK